MGRRSALRLVLLSLGCAIAFVAVYLVAVRTAVGQQLDVLTFGALYSLAPPATVPVLAWFARAVVIVVLACLVTLLAIAAVGRRSWRALVACVVIIGATVLATTYLRDDVLSRPRFSDEAFPQNSMPSTHVSVTSALVVAVVLLWPGRRPWWLVNTAGVVVLLASLGNVLGQAHRFSDVVASVALAGAIFFAVLAVVGRPRLPDYAGRPTRSR